MAFVTRIEPDLCMKTWGTEGTIEWPHLALPGPDVSPHRPLAGFSPSEKRSDEQRRRDHREWLSGCGFGWTFAGQVEGLRTPGRHQGWQF